MTSDDAAPAGALLSAICALGHRLRIGRWPDLEHPKALNEKIQAFKLRDRNEALVPLVDKVLVKDHVAGVLGADWVIPTLFAGPALPETRSWPVPYAVKANNSSGRNLFVADLAAEDWPAIRTTASGWMGRKHPPLTGEWLYTRITPTILVEPLLGGGRLPPDIKLFVIGGDVALIQVDTDRDTGHKRKLFAPDWTELDATLHYPRDPRPFPRPATLDAMIDAAQRLAKDIRFVRVDFYEVDGRPLFGEMTFTPGAGVERFTPDRLDFELGARWPWPAAS